MKFYKFPSHYFAALFLILLLAIAAFSMFKYSNTSSPKSTTATPTASHPNQSITSHVVVILLENENETYVIGNKDAPYMNEMLIPNYSIAENYYALVHPSLPNYIAITSGSTLNVLSNNYPVESLPYKNLVDLFSEHNISWKGYMESMSSITGSCGSELLSNAGGAYGYFTKHNPFVYYTDIMDNTTRCSQIVPLTRFSVDLENNQLPEFSFVTPNVLDDGHTAPQNASTCAPSGTGLQCADTWLSGFLPQVINSPVFANTIVFITWDESVKGAQTSNSFPNNKVLLIAVSPHSKKGFADNTTLYSHYSLLATIERIYGLGDLGRNDTTANVISSLFVNGTI